MKQIVLAFVFVLSSSVLEVHAATRSWTNTAGGNWFVAANWSPNGVPTGIDTANINNSGTYTVTILTGAVTVASINLGAASGTQTLLNGTASDLAITNAGTVGANGILTITNGGIQGNLTVQPSGQMLLSGTATKNLYQLTLINQGMVTWSGGQLNAGSTPSTVISNGGLWEITGDNLIYQYFGGAPLYWTNTGILRKSGGSGTTSINSFNFFNQPGGLVETLSGTLSFNGGTLNALGGTFNATAPGVMSIAGGTWTDAGGNASGTGTNQLAGGTLNLRTNIITGLRLFGGDVYVTGTNTFQQAGAITNLLLEGSQLRGTNRVGNGGLTINAGGADGQLTVQPGGQLLLPGGAAKNVYSLMLLNQGTVLWSGGTLQGGSTPGTIISNGGLWEVTGDNLIYQYYGGAPLYWINTGTLRKSGGSGTTAINSFNFSNQPGGMVETLSGTLSFNGGTESALGGLCNAPSGVMTIAGGIWTDAGGSASGTNQFAGGTLNLRTNIVPGLRLVGGDVYVTGVNTFQQAGAITNLTLDGSQLRGTNRVGNGALRVNTGGVDGQLTIQPGGQLLFSGSAAKNVYSLTLVNQGTVSWSGGTLQGGSTPGTVISNGGLWEITGDNLIYQYYGGAPLYWTNTGTLRKSGGNGTTSINSFNFFNQPGGLVETLSGTLSFNGGTLSGLGGSFSASAPAVMSIAGGTWTDAGGSASGTGTNRFSAGTLNLRFNIIPGLRLFGGDVYVTGASTFQQGGAITNLLLEGSQLRGDNRVGNGTLTINAGGADGQLTVQPGGQLLFAGGTAKNVYSLTLLNQGSVLWSGGTLQGGSTPGTVISNGGLWEITGNNLIYQYFGGAPLYWTNTGILRKSGGSGITGINSFNFFNQPGSLVDTLSGTLAFNGGNINALGGTFNATAPGVMSIAGGTWTDAGGNASGTGTNQLAGGTLNLRTNIIPGLRLFGGDVHVTGTNTFQQAGAITNLLLEGSQLRGTNRVGNGGLTINAGGADGQLTVQPGGQLLLAGGAAKNVYSLTLLNQGSVLWSGGTLQGGSTPSTVISNGGSWEITGDNLIYQYFGGAPLYWTNTGTLRKSGGSGTTTINSFNFFNQASGLIQADIGILSLPSPITNSAGTLRLNGGTIQSSGTYGMTGGTLDGAGAFGANAITGGIVSPGQSGPGLMGFRSGVNLGAGAILSLSGTGTAPGSQYDQLSVTGNVSLASATLQVSSLPSVSPGTTFVLVLNDGTDPVSGTFNGLAENAPLTVSGQPFRIHYGGGSGNDVTLVRDSGGVSTGPQLSNGGYSNGTFRVVGAGGSSVLYTIQATTNFIQWTNLGTATGDGSGNFIFIDPNANQFRYRFYRTTN